MENEINNDNTSSTYEISVNIKEKGDIISFTFKHGDTVDTLKEKLNKILNINFLNYYLTIANFHINGLFNKFNIISIIRGFKTNEFSLEKGDYMKLQSKEQNLKKLELDYKNSIEKEYQLQNKIQESNEMLDNLSKKEKVLRNYYRELTINTSVILNFTNTKNMDDESFDITEEQKVKQAINQQRGDLQYKQNELRQKKLKLEDITKSLVECKLKEKKALYIIKQNEALANQIYNFQKTLEKYKEKEEKVEVKENRLYNKLKMEIKLYEDSKGSKLVLYFRKQL